jgi:hypothetical protein
VDRTPRRIAVVVALGLTAMAISIPVAQGGIRPDDRAVHGVSVVAVEGTADLNTPATRPDDRAVRGVVALDGSDGTAESGASVVAAAPRVALAADQGFAWTDAAIGASTMLLLLCALAGAGLLIARQRKPALR